MSDQNRLSLPREQARVITTTHKTRPQMEAKSSRNLLKVLPWVNVEGGTYRVNRRRVLEIRHGHVTITEDTNGDPIIFGPSLNQIPALSRIDDENLLNQIATLATIDNFNIDDTVASAGTPSTHLSIIASGKISFYEPGQYNNDHLIYTMSKGHYYGEFGLLGTPNYDYDAKATTEVKVFKIAYADILTAIAGSGAFANAIADHITNLNDLPGQVNRKGESVIEMFAGYHDNEPNIPSTFVEYEIAPREYELYTAQTILKIHTKIADLYNKPYNQTEEQVRLTIEELREKQEDEMINNEDFGLLNNVDKRQLIHTETGPPTPDDMDELLSRRRKNQFILAHPKAIAAFTRECSKRGIYPNTMNYEGREVLSWRGVPLLTCNKLKVQNGLTSIIVLRVGEENQGVVGLYALGLPEEVEPSLSVRFMGIDEKAIISYLITNYFSVAPLVPDAFGVLTNVEVGAH